MAGLNFDSGYGDSAHPRFVAWLARSQLRIEPLKEELSMFA
jgi:hypothetical protein